jgi:hypothetical protein
VQQSHQGQHIQSLLAAAQQVLLAMAPVVLVAMVLILQHFLLLLLVVAAVKDMRHTMWVTGVLRPDLEDLEVVLEAVPLLVLV